jgi:hypothetical protein
MSGVVFESVSKRFRNRPALFNWIGRERRDVFFALRDLGLTINNGRGAGHPRAKRQRQNDISKADLDLVLPDNGPGTGWGRECANRGIRVRQEGD